MDLQNILQFQLLNNLNGNINRNTIVQVLFQIIVASSFKYIEKMINIFYEFIKILVENVTRKYTNNNMLINNIDNKLIDTYFTKTFKHDTYKVSLCYCNNNDSEKQNSNKSNRDFIILQAIFHHFTKLYNIPNIVITNNEYIPDLINQKFEIDDNIVCVIKELIININTNTLEKCKIELQSSTCHYNYSSRCFICAIKYS